MVTIEPRRLTLDLSGLATSVATSHDATEDVLGRGPTALVHDQRIGLFDARLTAELGLVHDLAVGLLLPLRTVRTRIDYVAAGEAVALVAPDVHHRNETLVGLGDPWLWARYGRGFGRFRLGARFGASLPLGRTEEDPFTLGDRGLRHQHLQFGTGTVNPLLSLEAGRAFTGFSVHAWFVTQQSLYENRHGYHAGDRYAAALLARSPLATERLDVQLGLEAQAETAERWHGVVHGDEGNQGRVDLLASAGASWRIGESWSISLSAKLPVYVYVKNAQLSYPIVGMVGLTTVFDFGDGHSHGDEHDHGDGHGDHGDAAAGEAPGPGDDVVEVAREGAAVDLVPVPGKVTVFDFWATWCRPCKELERGLLRLGREHPGLLAVRKIDVVDDESPAWRRHLAPGEHILPHVKVHAPDGRLLFARSGDPHALLDAIAEALRAARAP
jgi:thiol-disulfide isomerase/thioredoxin